MEGSGRFFHPPGCSKRRKYKFPIPQAMKAPTGQGLASYILLQPVAIYEPFDQFKDSVFGMKSDDCHLLRCYNYSPQLKTRPQSRVEQEAFPEAYSQTIDKLAKAREECRSMPNYWWIKARGLGDRAWTYREGAARGFRSE